jgi:hypothetical protein
MNPVVSVVIVSDYAAGKAETWDDLRTLLGALARQDFDGLVEFLLCECADLERQIPPDLTAILPTLKVILSPSSLS